MGIETVFYRVMIHVLQLVLFSLVGAYLKWFHAFDPVGENRSAEANLHGFIPLFCFVTFSKSVAVMTNESLGLIFFTFVISSSFCILFAVAYCWFAKSDVRITKVFVLLAAFGDVAFLPYTQLTGLCDKHGTFFGDANCAKNYGYSFYGLCLFNLALLVVGPFCMHRDKAIDYNVRRQMVMVRPFYKTAQAFLEDTDLMELDKAQKEREKDNPTRALPSPDKVMVEASPAENVGEKAMTVAHLFGKEGNSSYKDIFDNLRDSKVPKTVLEEQDLVMYAMNIHMDRDVYAKWQGQFDKFMQRLTPDMFNTLIAKVPAPEDPPQVNLEFLLGKIRCEIIECCVWGIVIGRQEEAMKWLYGEDGLKYFMQTVEDLAGLALPLAIVIWGVELYPGFHFKGRNIRLPDLIAIILIHLVIVPAIGLGFVHGLSNDNIAALDNDRVLMFSMYANWVVSPGLLLLTLFVLCGYYMKEGALMMFWSTIAEIPLAPLYTYAYLGVMDITP
ncbi:MAG: hypothetical protein P4L10_02270 [Acidobacteriaceae bacterium]|nr:hypothetical protein [Acidobacteriaceae bacterium]